MQIVFSLCLVNSLEVCDYPMRKTTAILNGTGELVLNQVFEILLKILSMRNNFELGYKAVWTKVRYITGIG